MAGAKLNAAFSLPMDEENFLLVYIPVLTHKITFLNFVNESTHISDNRNTYLSLLAREWNIVISEPFLPVHGPHQRTKGA